MALLPDDDDANLLEQYNECQESIKAMRATIAKKQSELGNVLADYVKSKESFHPKANKEAQNRMTFRQRKLLTGHFNKIHALSWSFSGYLSSSGQDQKIIIWNGTGGSKLCVIDLPDLSGMALTFESSKGEFVAAGGLDNECTIYKIDYTEQKSSKVASLSKHRGFISSCIQLDDCREMLTASGDGSILLWDVENSVPTQEFVGHHGDVMDIHLVNTDFYRNNNDSNMLLSSSTDGTCKIWDYRMNKSNNCVMTYYLYEKDVNCCGWFPDGNTFVSGSENGQIKMNDIRSHKIMNSFENESTNSVQSLCFSQSGFYLFAGMDGEDNCKVWKASTNEARGTLVHPSRCTTARMAPQGGYLATACWDTNIRIWA